MCGTIRVHRESWQTSLINSRVISWSPQILKTKQPAPNNQYQLNTQSIMLKFCKGRLVINVSQVIKIPLVASWIMEAFMGVWASLQFLLGFLLGFLHLRIVSFWSRVSGALQRAVISGASCLSNQQMCALPTSLSLPPNAQRVLNPSLQFPLLIAQGTSGSNLGPKWVPCKDFG